MRRETKSYPIAGLKAVDTETGRFEAVVSVFGNVDLHGHRIDAAAFDDSIERWQASGDPIPVIFSHQWDDLSSYLGTVDPSEVRALEPGDPDLPPAISEFGGLFVAGQLDTTEPEGRKAAKLLKSRAVREFSFAYDVLEEDQGDDGFLDLMELDLIEIGPTLKGANPLTQLVSAKSADLETVAEAFGLKAEEIAEIGAVLESLETTGATKTRTKAYVTLAGTLERLQESIHRAAVAWAKEVYDDQLYEVYIEGTYTDRAVIYVELWADPLGGGRYFEASYEVDGEEVSLGEPAPVAIEGTIKPKSRGRFGTKEGRRNASNDLERIQGVHDLAKDLGAECETADEDPDGEGSEEEEEDGSGTESRPKSLNAATLRTNLDLQLTELESDHED